MNINLYVIVAIICHKYFERDQGLIILKHIINDRVQHDVEISLGSDNNNARSSKRHNRLSRVLALKHHSHLTITLTDNRPFPCTFLVRFLCGKCNIQVPCSLLPALSDGKFEHVQNFPVNKTDKRRVR